MKLIAISVDCVWGEWKSSECSKEGVRELTREVEIPKILFGEKCQGPDHKTEKCEMPKGKCKSFSVSLKGLFTIFFFYCSNLIFWIVMGCGIADLGRRGL